MNINEEAAELLETTADRFATRQYTWAQGDFENQDGQLCALGGLAKTAGVLVDVVAGALAPFQLANGGAFAVANRRAAATLEELHQERSVSDWNDEEGREVEDVVDLFRHTAKDLRNG